MPVKKTGTGAKRSGGQKNTARSTASRGTAQAKSSRPTGKEAERRRGGDPESVPNQLAPYIFIIIALFISVCFIWSDATGFVGLGLRRLLYGLFSAGAIAVPVFIIITAIYWKHDTGCGARGYKAAFSFICLVLISVLVHVFTSGLKEFGLVTLWKNGIDFIGGGAVGGLVASVLLSAVGYAGTLIVSISALVILLLFVFGLTPDVILLYIKYYIHESKEKRAAYSDEKYVKVKRPRPVYITEEATAAAKPPVQPPAPPEEPKIDPEIFERVKAEEEEKRPLDEIIPPFDKPQQTAEPVAGSEKIRPEDTDAEKSPLEMVFADDGGAFDMLENTALLNPSTGAEITEAELDILRSAAVPDKAVPEKTEPPKSEAPVYEFPPVTLLKLDTTPKNVDISDELQCTAKKLVETLRSFKVRTKIVNVSRGPTITRYELVPEEGIRVRSITNLVDDISLKLATSGVRIEAPIPGKEAVGIEVPNQSVSTVFVRELIDSDRFRQSQSRLTVSLGVDVAGTPIYVDIAKMPHLLIAGATGMGKSVCINSMIVSLLYKATPDEVKLILIDPKKVELSIYSGLPHLLVPVVSDPKKAAGSLQWAVTEMERRFELIEEVGVRDVKNYNIATKNDHEKEFLPQIVIIIDELADLMMTAPADVEDSVCRLAQKARAAGMHLIIGTQRPSTDIITGVIKANIPSRIAFTVASQVDSRVILDMAGADKLIGRGDMLYAPIGASKPIRVQGAFVSENEIEAVVGFVRKKVGESEYDKSIIDRIEEEAARCGQGKKGGGASLDDEDDMESDPMLKAAIELAVESGKISTSLIQRRLSLGYGRSAKLIDRMEQMGIVSAPEGQKPRNVLISKQDYMEMVINKN